MNTRWWVAPGGIRNWFTRPRQEKLSVSGCCDEWADTGLARRADDDKSASKYPGGAEAADSTAYDEGTARISECTEQSADLEGSHEDQIDSLIGQLLIQLTNERGEDTYSYDIRRLIP